MERAGNEKKIRALFRELKQEDEQVAPQFVGVWNRAQARSTQALSPRPSRAFKISFAVTATLLIVALCSLALWSRSWQQGRQPSSASLVIELATPVSTSDTSPLTLEPEQQRKKKLSHRVSSTRRTRRLAARRQAELVARHAAIHEAAFISSWQSPTAMLMQSPAEDVLMSLPQLNQSAAGLQSFLPESEK
jgi:hypothetical protein